MHRIKMILHGLLRGLRAVGRGLKTAWRWTGENATSIRTVIAIFSLIVVLFVIVFNNASKDRDDLRRLTVNFAEFIVAEQRSICENAYDSRQIDRVNWHSFYDLLERYAPDSLAAIEEARGLFDANTPPYDPASCHRPTPQAVPDLLVTPTTTGD